MFALPPWLVGALSHERLSFSWQWGNCPGIDQEFTDIGHHKHVNALAVVRHVSRGFDLTCQGRAKHLVDSLAVMSLSAKVCLQLIALIHNTQPKHIFGYKTTVLRCYVCDRCEQHGCFQRHPSDSCHYYPQFHSTSCRFKCLHQKTSHLESSFFKLKNLMWHL